MTVSYMPRAAAIRSTLPRDRGVSYDRASDWRAAAACRADPELFFPVGASPAARSQEWAAKRVCSACPVLNECRAWVLANPQPDGVCGGMTEGERRTQGRRRRGEYERGRAAIIDGRALALDRGEDVILATVQGQDVEDIAKWSGVTLSAVRHALRILVPQEKHRADPTALERVLMSADTLRDLIATGRSDLEISRMLRTHEPVVIDARIVLDHRAAAADRIGLAA